MARIRPAKFVHVVYRTRRFEAMLRWYATVFDARIQHQDPVGHAIPFAHEHAARSRAGLTERGNRGGSKGSAKLQEASACWGIKAASHLCLKFPGEPAPCQSGAGELRRCAHALLPNLTQLRQAEII